MSNNILGPVWEKVQLAYAIGVAEPVSVLVDCFGTNTVSEDSIEKAIVSTFPLTPAGIIDYLKLKTPGYLDTACYGHFGRTGSRFTWENTNAVDDLLGNVSNK